MRLSAVLIKQTLDQLEDRNDFAEIYAVPDNNAVAARLSEVFGDHTFFVDREGLHIVEQIDADDGTGAAGKIVKLARWKDRECTTLAPQKPVATDVVVRFGSEAREEPDEDR